jgi:hypothetical protein
VHHKRGRPKKRRAGCLTCKPHKLDGAPSPAVARALQPDLPRGASETPLDEVDTAGDVCPHGGDAGCCEEWECLTGEPVQLVSPPLAAPVADGARIDGAWLAEVAKPQPVDDLLVHPMTSRPPATRRRP